jgi:hypothetical protein
MFTKIYHFYFITITVLFLLLFVFKIHSLKQYTLLFVYFIRFYKILALILISLL